jgi:putative FmdB family regulatory protein
MPIYEYRCEACSHELEALQKLSDAPLLECPQCKAPALRKQVSAAGFRLKGSGWYETDFKSGSKKNVAGEKDSGASSTTSADTSAAKPAAAAVPSTPAPASNTKA